MVQISSNRQTWFVVDILNQASEVYESVPHSDCEEVETPGTKYLCDIGHNHVQEWHPLTQDTPYILTRSGPGSQHLC